ncbi:hypothetical protein D3C76_917660 [compost metagenome]
MVIAIPAHQFIACIIGLHDIVEGIACSFGGSRGEHEIFDVAGYDVVDGSDDVVDAFTCNFLDQVAKVIDVVGVVTGAAGHGVIAPVTIQDVIAAEAAQSINPEAAL